VRLIHSTIGKVLSGKTKLSKHFLYTFITICGVDPVAQPSWGGAWDRLDSLSAPNWAGPEDHRAANSSPDVQAGAARANEKGRPDLSGKLLTQPEGDTLYLVNPEGCLQEVPDELTRHKLFLITDGSFIRDEAVEKYPGIECLPKGAPLTAGACLIRDNDGKPVYILSNKVKRWIKSPEALDKYHFNRDAIVGLPAIVVEAIPSGDDWS
jgi:hypothetical protein